MRKKLALLIGLGAVLSLLHAGCSGLSGSVCQAACDCQANCDHNALSICEDDADDVQSKVDIAGCDKLYDALLTCEADCSCKDGALDVSPCKAKSDAVQACLDAHAGQ